MKKEGNNTKWLCMVFFCSFSLYWLSNVVLWYPWIISPALGMTLMLTLGTALWSFGIYFCLKRYPRSNLFIAAILCGIVMLVVSMLSDYLFFGIIRGAMEELYHPTTLYGYGFLAALPFIETLLFKKNLSVKKAIHSRTILLSLIPGILSFCVLTLFVI